MNISGSFEKLTVDDTGKITECKRMSLRSRLRRWAMGKLGAVDRAACERYAVEYLGSNGNARVVVITSGKVIDGETIFTEPNQAGVAVAPWATGVVLSNLTIIGQDKGPSVAIRVGDSTNIKVRP